MPARNYAVDLRMIHRVAGSAAVTATANFGDADAGVAYIDMGAATNTLLTTVVNLEAIGVVGTEDYVFAIQVSNTTDFATVETAAVLEVGPSATRVGGAPTNAAGDSYNLYWSTRVNETEYRYWRIRLIIGGTSPTITFNSYSSRIQ